MKISRALLCSVFFLLIITAIAQDKKLAMISGVVQDSETKLPLVEAVVTLSSDAFKGQKFAITDSSGFYSVKNLPLGIYSISFEMEGYRKFTRDSIRLTEGMSLGASFQMAKDRTDRKKQKQQD